MQTRTFVLSLAGLLLFWCLVIVFTVDGPGPATTTTAPAGDPGSEAVDGARRYLRRLFARVHDSHPALADVEAEQFVSSIRATLEELIRQEPERARRLGLASTAVDGARDGETWARAVIPDGSPARDLEDRVDFFAEALVLATEDPFTRLITGDRFGNLGMILRQFFPSTIGVFLEEDGEGLYLAIVVRGSGAEAAGLRAGDRVLAVNGRRAADLSLRQARRLVEEGSCRFQLQRDGGPQIVELDVYPTEIRGMMPIGFLVTPEVAYLRFTMFTGLAGGQLLTVARRLVDEGARAFVLDLRGNPGGAVSDAWVIADLFLEAGLPIVELEQRPTSQVELPRRLVSTSAVFGEEYPLAVLIDRSSASASELLGGALQDHRRALLVGERSYGKGVGQSTMAQTLQGIGDGQRIDTLALTCFRFNSPRGRNVHGKGLHPDLVVATPSPPLARTRLQAELVASECLITALRELELPADEVAALREQDRPLPASIRELATRCKVPLVSEDHVEALREVCRLVLEFRHVELAACPGSGADPALDKALRVVEVMLR